MMSGDSEPEVAAELDGTEGPPGRWRYWLGLALLVFSLILPILALVIVPILGFPEDVNSVLFALSLAGGPDLLLVLAAAAMGKENIDRILGKVAPWFKRLVHWDRVTRTRYVVGLWILSASVVLPVVIGVFFENSVVNADNQPDWGYYVMVASYFGFLAAFFIMGGPLWDRIRALFTWNATITFPPTENDNTWQSRTSARSAARKPNKER